MAGHITDSQLIAKLNSGNLNPVQRETIVAVLKLVNNHHAAAGSAPAPLMPPRPTLTPSPTPQVILSL